ncbi:Cys-tRNA(Pro) deacylase [Pseudobacillus badius]|uniref:Cys-tRNA(Pro) deacylase n=1 Tax=Bacillus badius TaxID=1455 RepID=UPI0007B052A8|nr:Cys-tRNA(Pro) deacylase [Bacillus badius]KZN99878.1 aminoacyl-tRNA deacylase [Bacillus badius]MED0668442.1 Cys-tRNA(Pro) deacylase [Bacillus badius]OCS86049.1 aminoacyl-tRNA deacylase [Bacillus badius]OVE52489.1 aminoacyl-tRNA deacylase [Bacillus badius]TDW04243.1 Cys-tRNA(Pro)/Cys-tRNA(Cys) deacylase [Bacillus badius]
MKGKTNAMRILDKAGLTYEMYSYDPADGKIDGLSAAEKIGKEADSVFKTLVTIGTDKQIYVFVIPVAAELDLKKAAKAAGAKKLDMIPVKDIQKYTGYIRGGCSPIGMKKLYPTFLDARTISRESIVVSAGKIGKQMELKTADLISVTHAVTAHEVIK